MLLGVLTSAKGGGSQRNKAGLWQNLSIWLSGSDPVWLRPPQLTKSWVKGTVAPFSHPVGSIKFWWVQGVVKGGQKNLGGMQNFFLFICIWLLCALKHDLIIFIIASASSATNLIEGNKIIQPLQKMQP